MFRRLRELSKNQDKSKPLELRGELVVILDSGDEIISSLKEVIRKYSMQGFFFGLGAVRDPVIAYFDLDTKKYVERKLEGEFEVLSLVGNLGITDEGEPIVHAHITLGDKEYRAFGGHLVEGHVSITMEIIIIRTDLIKRSKDERFGLFLVSDAT